MNEKNATKTVMVKWGANGYVTLAHPLATPRPYDGAGAPAIVAITNVPNNETPGNVARLMHQTSILWTGGMPDRPEISYDLLGRGKIIQAGKA